MEPHFLITTSSFAAGKGVLEREKASLHVKAISLDCLMLQDISCFAGQKPSNKQVYIGCFVVVLLGCGFFLEGI